MADFFTFYVSWRDAIRDLPDDVRLEVYEAAVEYAATGTRPALKPLASVAFNFIKDDIDRQMQRSQDLSNKRKEAVQQRWQKKQADTKNTNVSFVLQADTNGSNINKEEIKTNEIVDEDKSSLSEPVVSDAPESHRPTIDFNALIDFWNSTTKGVFGTLVKPMGEKRKQMVRARIASYGKDKFIEAIKKAAASEFLQGWNGMSFDWLIKPSNFEKVISGNYDKCLTDNRIANGTSRGLNNAECVEAVIDGLGLAAGYASTDK